MIWIHKSILLPECLFVSLKTSLSSPPSALEVHFHSCVLCLTISTHLAFFKTANKSWLSQEMVKQWFEMHGTCTRATPAMRISSESHWYTPSLRPSMDTENRAVVRIFSWYVTWWRQRNKRSILRSSRRSWGPQINLPCCLPGRWLRPGWRGRHTAGCSAVCRSLRGSPASVFLRVCEWFPDGGRCWERACCNLQHGKKTQTTHIDYKF